MKDAAQREDAVKESPVIDEDEELIQLRPNQHKKLQFPPGCPVVKTVMASQLEDREEDDSSLPQVTYGTVQTAYLHLDTRRVLYKIDAGGWLLKVDEKELAFGRKAPVYTSLPETPEPIASQILNVYQEPDGTLLYSIHTVASNSICHFIAADCIKYRPAETDAAPSPQKHVASREAQRSREETALPLGQTMGSQPKIRPPSLRDVDITKDKVLGSVEETTSLTQAMSGDSMNETNVQPDAWRASGGAAFSRDEVHVQSETSAVAAKKVNDTTDAGDEKAEKVCGAAGMRAGNDWTGHHDGVMTKQLASTKNEETPLPLLVSLPQSLKCPVADSHFGHQVGTGADAAQIPDRDRDTSSALSSSKRPASIDNNHKTKRPRMAGVDNTVEKNLVLPKFVNQKMVRKGDKVFEKLYKETNCEIKWSRSHRTRRSLITIRGAQDAVQNAIPPVEDAFLGTLDIHHARQFMYDLANENPDYFRERRKVNRQVIVYQREPNEPDDSSLKSWKWMSLTYFPSSWDTQGAISMMVGPKGRGIKEVLGACSCYAAVTLTSKPGFFVSGESLEDVEECTRRVLKRIDWGKKRYDGPK